MMNRLPKDPLFYILVVLSVASMVAAFTLAEGPTAEKIANMKTGSYNPYREFNLWLNGLFFNALSMGHLPSYLEEKLGPHAGYYCAAYLRDLFAGICVYWITAGLWHIAIYHVFVDELFHKKKRALPTAATIIDQMQLAQASLFVYAALPILSEFLIENNLTQTYFYIDQIGGWTNYFLLLVAYYTFVEIGIYWVHRTLHTNKFLYKYIHGLHHKYNKDSTLTPWCSIAFNPIDGILQASPYVVGLFFIPMHYYTHMIAVFLTGIWATYIHDSALGHFGPIMGSHYHTIHHTHYHYNFGQFFIFCDYFWGSLRSPESMKGVAAPKDN